MRIIIILFLFFLNLNSKDFSYTYPSTRANSMGTAFSSIADDVFSMFYNPAGLTQVKDWESGASINSKLSDRNLFDLTLAYRRPVPDTKDTVVGFGYDRVKQSNLGSMDTFLFSYSNQTTIKYFQLPILYGGNLRLGAMTYEGNSHIGLGFDAGVILSSIENYKTSIVLSRITTGMGKSMATITIGNSYRYFDTTFALDFRVTGGYSEFFWGIERKFFDDILRIRTGKGVNLDGRDYLAMGAGLNFNPVIIDIIISYPWKGFNQNAGNYGFSLSYKFTGPSYKERMYDDASQKVKELNEKAENLKKEISELETESLKYQTEKGILESEVTILNQKMIELREKAKEAEIELIDIEYSKKKPAKPVEEKITIKKEEKWPKLHKVENGETLRSISSKYYGTPDMWKLIYDENQSKIFKGLPKEGEILVIPPPKK